MRRYTAADIDAAIFHVDTMLRDLGAPPPAGACQCARCTRQEAPTLALKPAPTGGPKLSALVPNPTPSPRTPRPGGIAIQVPEIVF